MKKPSGRSTLIGAFVRIEVFVGLASFKEANEERGGKSHASDLFEGQKRKVTFHFLSPGSRPSYFRLEHRSQIATRCAFGKGQNWTISPSQWNSENAFAIDSPLRQRSLGRGHNTVAYKEKASLETSA